MLGLSSTSDRIKQIKNIQKYNLKWLFYIFYPNTEYWEILNIKKI